jgi:hypothetical protein
LLKAFLHDKEQLSTAPGPNPKGANRLAKAHTHKHAFTHTRTRRALAEIARSLGLLLLPRYAAWLSAVVITHRSKPDWRAGDGPAKDTFQLEVERSAACALRHRVRFGTLNAHGHDRLSAWGLPSARPARAARAKPSGSARSVCAPVSEIAGNCEPEKVPTASFADKPGKFGQIRVGGIEEESEDRLRQPVIQVSPHAFDDI